MNEKQIIKIKNDSATLALKAVYTEIYIAFKKLYLGNSTSFPNYQLLEEFASLLTEESNQGVSDINLYISDASKIYSLLNYMFDVDNSKIIEYIAVDKESKKVITNVKTIKDGMCISSTQEVMTYSDNERALFEEVTIEELRSNPFVTEEQRYSLFINNGKGDFKNWSNIKSIEDNYKALFSFLNTEQLYKRLSLEDYIVDTFHLLINNDSQQDQDLATLPKHSAVIYAIYHAFRIVSGEYASLPRVTRGKGYYKKQDVKDICKREYKGVGSESFSKTIADIFANGVINEQSLKFNKLDNSYGNWKNKVLEIARHFDNTVVCDFINNK